MPSPTELRPERNRDTNLLCDHRLYVDQSLDWQEADATDARDDMLLLLRISRRGRTDEAH